MIAGYAVLGYTTIEPGRLRSRWLLDAGPERVRSRADDARPGAVAVYIAGDEKFEQRFGRADGVSRETNRLPRGEPDLRSGPFVVYVAQRC